MKGKFTSTCLTSSHKRLIFYFPFLFLLTTFSWFTCSRPQGMMSSFVFNVACPQFLNDHAHTMDVILVAPKTHLSLCHTYYIYLVWQLWHSLHISNKDLTIFWDNTYRCLLKIIHICMHIYIYIYTQKFISVIIMTHSMTPKVFFNDKIIHM